ncbi:MAG: hypothetical protein R3C10_21625 [Pirellulales bacterium]
MVDAHAEKVLTIVNHVIEDRDDVARPNVAASQAGRTGVDPGGSVNLHHVVRAVQRVHEGGFHLAREVVTGRRERIVHPLDHGERLAVFQGVDDALRGERAETADVQATGGDPFLLAEIVDRRLRRFHVGPHADDDIVGILATVRLDEIVLASRLAIKLFEGVGQGRFDLVVIPTLGNLALHVRVLVLHDAGHHRIGRVDKVEQLLARCADVLLHEFAFGQVDFLDRVGREEAVLHVHKGRIRGLGRAAADQAEVTRLLGIATEKHAPTAVGDAHHVVVSGMHVERMTGQGTSTDVEHGRQAFSGDRVQHLFHQHEALAGREVGHATAGRGETFTEAGSGVFTFGFGERELLAPDIGDAVS